MSHKKSMFLFRSISLVILCASVAPIVSAEILFDREITQAERDRHVIRQTEIFFNRGVTPEQIKEYVVERANWRPDVVKVELLLVSRADNRPPRGKAWKNILTKDGRPYLNVVYLATVLYEREVTEYERRRFHIPEKGRRFDKDKAATLDQLIKKLKYWPWGLKVIRVELKLGGRYLTGVSKEEKMTPYVRPYLEILSLGKDIILQAKVKKWRKDAPQRLAIGKDFGGFRFIRTTTSGLGRVTDTYRSPKGDINVTIHEGVDRIIPLHQFLRRIIDEDCTVKKTKFGYVVVSQDKYRGRPNHWKVSWRSGNSHLVSITSLGLVPIALAPRYGEKFPSTLPRKFKIDKRAWGRAEMERILAEMKACLEREDRPKDPYFPDPSPWTPFRTLMGKLRGHHVYFPLAQEMFEALNHQTPLEAKVRMLKRLTQWWQENKKRTYWHKKEQCLVAKGQSKGEIAKKRRREAQKRAKQELEAKLNAPLSGQEIKAAKEKLAAVFARDLDIGFQRKEMKDSPRINELFFRREGDRWIRSRPDPLGAGRIIRTFEIISFKRQEKKRRALRVEVRDRKLRTRQNVYDEWVVIYEYDKIRGVWHRVKVTHLGQRQVNGNSK